MTVYFVNLIVSCLLCSSVKKNQQFNARGKKSNSFSLALFFLFFLWVFFYTFRYRVGSDSWSFNASFEIFKRTEVSLRSYLSYGPRDKLFSLVYYFCVKTLGMKRVWFYMVMAALTYYPVIKTLEQKKENLTFLVFLYCATLSCYAGYNGTRQAVAVGFVMLAYHTCLLKGKRKQYIIIMLIAIGFHSAALFAIPFHLLSLKPLRSGTVKTTVVLIIISIIFLNSLWEIIIQTLDLIGQDKMASDYASFYSKSAHYLRVAVQIVPTLIILLRFQTIKRQCPDIEPLVVLNLLAGALSFAMLQNSLLARVVSIVDVSGLFLVPKIPYAFSTNGKRSGTAPLIATAMVVLYLVYMVLILRSGDSHLYPYQFLPNLDATWY